MKTLTHLIIVGRIGTDDTGKKRGQMAKALRDGCELYHIPYTVIPRAPFPEGLPAGTAVAFASSMARFPGVLEACELNQWPLVIVSSKIPVPSTAKTVVINGPNLGLLNLIMLDVFPRIAALVKSLDAVSFVGEFHQETKPKGSATAEAFATMLGIQPQYVGSGRSSALARIFLDVPIDYFEGFARIGILIEFGRSRLRLSLETDGRSSYFDGLMTAIRRYFANEEAIKPGVYELHKIIFPPDSAQQALVDENIGLKQLLRDYSHFAQAANAQINRQTS